MTRFSRVDDLRVAMFIFILFNLLISCSTVIAPFKKSRFFFSITGLGLWLCKILFSVSSFLISSVPALARGEFFEFSRGVDRRYSTRTGVKLLL